MLSVSLSPTNISASCVLFSQHFSFIPASSRCVAHTRIRLRCVRDPVALSLANPSFSLDKRRCLLPIVMVARTVCGRSASLGSRTECSVCTHSLCCSRLFSLANRICVPSFDLLAFLFVLVPSIILAATSHLRRPTSGSYFPIYVICAPRFSSCTRGPRSQFFFHFLPQFCHFRLSAIL
jgi:hypothetical protein